MINNYLEYRPYKTYIYFAPILIAISAFELILFGYLLACSIDEAYILLAIAIIGGIGAISLYHDSCVLFVMNNNMVEIISPRRCRQFLWEDFNYMYESYNSKGYKFLVLSKDSLINQQIKSIVNKGSIRSKSVMGEVIIIPIKKWQDTSKLIDFVKSKMFVL